jgi:tellurite resistance protein
MPNQTTRNRFAMTKGTTMAAYLDDREDELLDAVVTAAALVARADGWIDAVERSELLNFLNRHGLLSAFTRAEVLDFFERRVHQLEGDSGAAVAVGSLRRLAGRSLARLVVDAGEHVAAADGHLHPREAHILLLIRIALTRPSLSPLENSPDSGLGVDARGARSAPLPDAEIPNTSKI